MQQRGAVVMQSRAGLLQPVRVDPKKQRGFPAAAKVARAGDSRQLGPMRNQGIGDAGDRPPTPHLRRGHPPDLATRRQLQEAQELEPSMGVTGGMGRGRGGPPRPMMVPVDRLPPEMARQLAQGPVTLHLGPPPPHLHPGYFPAGAPKHFTSKSGEPPDKARQGPRRGVAAMAHLASPVRVSSSPTAASPREFPAATSPRELHLASPRTLANTPPATARGFTEDNTSPRYSSDAEKTPRSGVGRQEGGWKASPRLSAEAPMNSPRGGLAQGDAGAGPEGRRGVPRDRGDERLLRNLNLKAAENKGGTLPNRTKPPTNTASELNRTPNDATSGRVLPHGNPHMAGGGAIYQMDRKGQFGRGGPVGPPQGVAAGARPGQFPGPQHQQMPTMSSPKINPARAPADHPRLASQKKPPTVLAKKTALSTPKPPPAFSPALFIASPATSPMNSPRPSLMASKNIVSGKLSKAANASPGSSPTRVPKSASPRNSPARTYVITPKDSPTALPVPLRKIPARSPQATSAANVSAKLQMDSVVPQTTVPTTAGKDRKGKYQNPKTRLSAGGDLQTAKGRPKPGAYRGSAGEAASPPGDKVAVAPTPQAQPSREANDPRQQPKEPSDLNKGQLPTKASPLVRKLTKTSLLPVQNPSTPRSVVSQHLPEEEQGKSGNTVAKQAEGSPRKTNAGEGNRKPPPPARNRRGAMTGAAHTEGPREVGRGRAVAGRPRRGGRAGRDSLDVAAALPDTSGNFTSAVHQWLRQSHYKVISPQQYRQHETIQEETVKQTGLAEKATAFKDERPQKAAAAEPEKAAPKPQPQPPAQDKDKDRERAGAGRRGRAAPAAPRKHKDVTALPKMAAAAAAARAGKKASKAAAAAVACVESGKRRPAAKRGAPKGITAKARGARRKKDKGKLPPSACPRLRPRVGPAGDSGDLSTSSEGSSFLSASDEAMNEQSTMC